MNSLPGQEGLDREGYTKRINAEARSRHVPAHVPAIYGTERDEYTLVKFQSYIHSVDFANPSPLYGSLYPLPL